MNISIIGAGGYSGLELIRILHQHKKVSNITLYHTSHHVKLFSDSYPHTRAIVTKSYEEIDIEKMIHQKDVVFLATPAGVASQLAPPLIEEGVTVIDLSGDFRLKNSEEYEKWYRKAAAPSEYLHQSIYGLTEWNEEIKNASLVSNPGCYATAVLLGLAPLVREKIIKEDAIIIDAKSGVSGAGKSPTTMTHFAETNDNLKIYRVNTHQHIPEIEQQLSSWNKETMPITFSTHLLPITRGIMATMYVEAKEEINLETLRELYISSYEHKHFVRIQSEGYFPSIKQVVGSNFCDIGLTYDERTNRITIVSVIDNLMKGAAGQAVQNFNTMYGFPETEGLDFIPIYP